MFSIFAGDTEKTNKEKLDREVVIGGILPHYVINSDRDPHYLHLMIESFRDLGVALDSMKEGESQTHYLGGNKELYLKKKKGGKFTVKEIILF